MGEFWRYWGRVVKRAWTDAWKAAEPHKEMYAAVTGALGALGMGMRFGTDADPLRLGVLTLGGAVAGIALGLSLTFVLQFLAVPARLDREWADEVKRLRWERGETYAAMAQLAGDVDRLTRASSAQDVMLGWPAVVAALADLRPRVRDDEFLALTRSMPNERPFLLPSEMNRALTGLRDGLVQLMREYR